MRGYGCGEHREVPAGFGPSAIVNLGCETYRGKLPTGPLGDRKTAPSVPDANIRLLNVNPIEADQIAVIHCKAYCGAIGGKLRVCQPGKRLNEGDIEVWKIQDQLRYRYLSRQRRKIDAKLACREFKFIDVGETARLKGDPRS